MKPMSCQRTPDEVVCAAMTKEKTKEKNAPSGSRTPISCLEGKNDSRYTNGAFRHLSNWSYLLKSSCFAISFFILLDQPVNHTAVLPAIGVRLPL